jgi:hypothetical protein
MTKVFVASNLATDFPRKLQKPSTINQRVRETAETYIMDSGIGDDVSNAEVLDLADEYNADYVIGKDYLHDHDRTTESVREFMELHADHACTATPMVPLQPPHAEHYRDLPDFTHYVLGGLAVPDVPTADAIRYIREFRDVAPDVYAHGLGVGGGIEFTRTVARNGWLDSIDCSTPEQAAMFGSVLDAQLRQQQVRVKNGEGVAKRNTALADFNSWQVQDVWNREAGTDTHRDTSLTEFH